MGAVKTVTADSLAINDGPGKDWTSVIDATTKIIPRKGQETIDVTQASPMEGGKRIPSKPLVITDMKEDQRVEVKYHNVNGKDARHPSSSDVAEPTFPSRERPPSPDLAGGDAARLTAHAKRPSRGLMVRKEVRRTLLCCPK